GQPSRCGISKDSRSTKSARRWASRPTRPSTVSFARSRRCALRSNHWCRRTEMDTHMHLTEDDLVLHYYGELEGAAAARAGNHLRECADCHASFTTLQRVLAAVESAPPVDLGEGFERKVWARLQPELEPRRKGWLSWFILSPARLAWVAGIAILV